MVFRLLNGCYCHSWSTRGPLHVLLGSLFGPFIRLLVHCVSLEDPGVMLQWRVVYYNFLPKMFGFGLLSGNCEWHDGVYSWPTNQQYHMTKRVRVASIVLGWLVTPLHQYADCYWADVAERNQECLKRSLMPLILALGLWNSSNGDVSHFERFFSQNVLLRTILEITYHKLIPQSISSSRLTSFLCAKQFSWPMGITNISKN